MNCYDLIAFAENEGCADLAKYLQKRFLRDISCFDPTTTTGKFLLISDINDGQFLHEIRSQILRVILLLEIATVSSKINRDLLHSGGSPKVLDEVVHIGSIAKKTLINEGYDSGYYEHYEVSS